MSKKSFKNVLCSLILGLMMLSGCSSPSEDNNTIIKFANNSFDSQMLHNEIAKFIVENGFEGYKVEFSTASSTMNWQAIIKNDVDLDVESWTANVITYADNLASGEVVELGDIIPNGAQGFYVPRYIIEGDAKRNIKPLAPDLKHVRDLIKYPNVFKSPESDDIGRIYGAIPGWIIDEIMYNKYLHYKLDEKYEYTRLGSEAAMYASLNSAYNRGEGWVGYSFDPTLITGKFDLILLEDEPFDESVYAMGGCEIPLQRVKIISSGKFAERAPDLIPFFKKFQTGSAEIAAVLVYLDESKASYADSAKWFLRNNPELLAEWLTEEQTNKVQAALKSDI